MHNLDSGCVVLYIGPFPHSWNVNAFPAMATISGGSGSGLLRVDGAAFPGTVTWLLSIPIIFDKQIYNVYNYMHA